MYLTNYFSMVGFILSEAQGCRLSQAHCCRLFQAQRCRMSQAQGCILSQSQDRRLSRHKTADYPRPSAATSSAKTLFYSGPCGSACRYIFCLCIWIIPTPLGWRSNIVFGNKNVVLHSNRYEMDFLLLIIFNHSLKRSVVIQAVSL